VRGVYQRGSPVGTVVGATQCYVDVNVPHLKPKVRVRKTLVVRCDDEKGGEKFKNVVKEEPLVGAALHAVCTLLVKHRVQKGDEGFH
jgi:hypothetical protein